MKKIKIILLAFAAFVSSAVFAAETIPEFTDAPNAFVVNAKPVKGQHSDFIQVINFTDDENIKFSIYGWRKKDGWTKLASDVTSTYGDSKKLETEYDHQFNRWEVFAFVPENGKTYKIEYTKFKIEMWVVEHHFGAFRIIPDTAVPGKNAYIFENASVKGSFKDNIKAGGKNGVSLKILGSNDKESWETVGGGKISVEEADDYCSLEAVNEKKTASYKFYSVETVDGKKCEFDIFKSHNDLYFVVK
ncbi:MAG: hypothetical protein KBT21_04910 [Treponema sp.]|nr:hypothetical protein [Candidatus Treponema merdequi]